jgi:hypothetical protein
MATPKCDCNVKVACKIADIICGGVPIVFDNVKDITMIQPVTGPMQCMELKRVAVMEELCAIKSPKERAVRNERKKGGLLKSMLFSKS